MESRISNVAARRLFAGCLVTSLAILVIMALKTSDPLILTYFQESLTPRVEADAASDALKEEPPRRVIHTGLCLNDTFTHMYAGEPWMPELVHSEIERTVYYVWCSDPIAKSYFDFRHFLSVRSAITYVSAEAVYLYYDVLPPIDDMWYNTWLIDLQNIYPFLVLRQTDVTLLCRDNGDGTRVNWEFLSAEMNRTGGVFIREFVLLSDEVPGMVKGTFSVSTTPDGSTPAVVTGKQGTYTEFLEAVTALSKTGSARPPGVLYNTCSAMATFSKGDHCVLIDKEPFFPKDTWDDDDNLFNQLCRRLLYGSTDLRKPIKHDHEVIPRNCHYNWFGGGSMNFMFYVSVLSCLHVLKMDTVCIHGNKPPSGEFWGVLQAKYPKKVVWIRRAQPNTVFGKTDIGVAHQADIAGTDIMVKHGGVHSDPDSVFIREIPSDLFHYDAVMPVSPIIRPEYPITTSWGVYMGAPNSELWKMVRESHRCFITREWHWNCERLVYKIYERNPHIGLIDPNLQVFCQATGTCWHQPGKLVTSNMTGWMSKVYALHYVHGVRALRDMEHAKTDVTMNGAAIRIILKAAGLL